jgi:hypothetical protein
MVKTLYIGYAIDMDGAANGVYNSKGIVIPLDHYDYQKHQDLKKEFLEGMDILFKRFEQEGALNGVTWFVNEAGYHTTVYYPEIIQKCIDTGGEIGLHTHFDGTRLGGQGYKISENIKDWYQMGLVDPIGKLKKATNKPINIFKSGCHLRNDDMFNALGELGFVCDTTMVYEDTVSKSNGVVMFDDRELLCGTPPFYIETQFGKILEIPEIRPSLEKVKRHIENTPEDCPVFLRFQIHPWNAVSGELLLEIDRVLKYCNDNYDVKYTNIRTMSELYNVYNNQPS